MPITCRYVKSAPGPSGSFCDKKYLIPTMFILRVQTILGLGTATILRFLSEYLNDKSITRTAYFKLFIKHVFQIFGTRM